VLDWRGQGGSGRLLGNPLKSYVANFADYSDDVARFMNEVALPDCPPPYYALAHSMGATVLLEAATLRGCWFSRMVLLAPMLRIEELPFRAGAVAALSRGLSLAGFGRLTVPGGMRRYRTSEMFEGNPCTSDYERFTRNQAVLRAAPALKVGPPTIGWISAAMRAMADVSSDAFPDRLRLPILMLAAGEDRVVSSKAIEDLALRLKVGTQILLRGSRHEILQERDLIREQFWAAFDAFVPGAATSRYGERVVA
jgi:lysophospholipase